MTEQAITQSVKIMNELIAKHKSMREFARVINEDPSDIHRWKTGKAIVKVRAIITIARLYGVKPYDLDGDLFPQDLEFVFKKR